MPRPKRIRKVNKPPHFKGFSPIGLPKENNPILLNYEEYESIRLNDFELNGHVEAANMMGVSRPTYTRIYESARRKVAQAFVLGKAIVFEGGKVYFDSDWYSCNGCGCWFNHPAKEQAINNCSLCGSNDIEPYTESAQQGSEEDVCICPKCNFQKVHVPGIPCKKEICPTCNTQMMRKGTPHFNRNNNCK